jgi:hypothetical protein
VRVPCGGATAGFRERSFSSSTEALKSRGTERSSLAWALVDGEQRIERVIAKTPLTLLVVEAHSLGYLVRTIPELDTRLLAALRDRLRKAAAAQTHPTPLPDRQPAIQRAEPIAVSEPTSY